MKRILVVLLMALLSFYLMSCQEKNIRENISTSKSTEANFTPVPSPTVTPELNVLDMSDLTIDSILIRANPDSVEAKFGKPQSVKTYTEEATGNTFTDWKYGFGVITFLKDSDTTLIITKAV